LEVVHFETVAVDSTVSSEQAFPIEARLPSFPWTYHGRMIKVRWAIRVRVLPVKGKEFGGEYPFVVRPPWVPAKKADLAEAVEEALEDEENSGDPSSSA